VKYRVEPRILSRGRPEGAKKTRNVWGNAHISPPLTLAISFWFFSRSVLRAFAPSRFDSPVSGLAQRIRAGERGALARGISLVEAGDARGRELASLLYRDGSGAHIVGITGPPGAGKSTLTDALTRAYRQRGERVAVLAVDPVSPLTGGATLGDRTRMMAAASDAGVFIRSSAARGHDSGLGFAAVQVMRLMAAAGYGRVLIETVGTGQDGVSVASVAATVLLVQTPGAGDEVQALKAGVLEIADIFVVNKAETPGADALIDDLRDVARATGTRGDWTPPVVPTTATSGAGVPGVLDAIEAHRVHLDASGEGETRRAARLLAEVRALVRHDVLTATDAYLRDAAVTAHVVHAFATDDEDPLTVAQALFRRWKRDIKSG